MPLLTYPETPTHYSTVDDAYWLVRGPEALDYIGMEGWVLAELSCGHVYAGDNPGPAWEQPGDLVGAVVVCADCGKAVAA